jgi:hypothetical protein
MPDGKPVFQHSNFPGKAWKRRHREYRDDSSRTN